MSETPFEPRQVSPDEFRGRASPLRKRLVARSINTRRRKAVEDTDGRFFTLSEDAKERMSSIANRLIREELKRLGLPEESYQDADIRSLKLESLGDALGDYNPLLDIS